MCKNDRKGNRGFALPVIVIILVAASTTQLSSMIVSNGNTVASYDVYAQFPTGPRPPPGQQFPPVHHPWTTIPTSTTGAR